MSLPRYRRPVLKVVGKGTERKLPQRRLAYAEVTRRAKGMCEVCGARQDPLDPHHAFGRGHLPGIPAIYCDSAELILGICRDCHTTIHDHPEGDTAHDASWMALERFALKHRLDWNVLADDVLDEMRRLCRLLEEREVA